jgi:hypothetical protein
MSCSPRVTALFAAALLVLGLAGCASNSQPVDLDPVSPDGASVADPADGSTPEATAASTEPIAAPTTEAPKVSAADIMSGEARACKVLSLDAVVTVVEGDFGYKDFPGTNSCLWSGDQQSLLLEIDTTPWVEQTMARYSDDLDYPSPCPDAEKSLYAAYSGSSTAGVWCLVNGVNFLVEVRPAMNGPDVGPEQYAALGPIMSEVLSRVS